VTLAGGCLCGKVRYRADAAPRFQLACHCSNCQRQSGAPFLVNLGVPKPAFAVIGVVKSYRHQGDSGRWLTQFFCPDCGSPIWSELDLDPGYAIIKSGTLDDRGLVRPQRHIFWASHQGWEERPTDAPVHDGPTPGS
jgi:hypothetical protein